MSPHASAHPKPASSPPPVQNQAGSVDVRLLVDRIIAAFSESDVDAALAFFRDDAIYETLSGARRHGRAAIRREFTPQFRGDYGAMRFDLSRVIVDEPAREAAIAWTCEHALDQGRPAHPLGRLVQRSLRAVVGTRGAWDGVDLFRFDELGQIIEKRTFAKARVIAIRRG